MIYMTPIEYFEHFNLLYWSFFTSLNIVFLEIFFKTHRFSAITSDRGNCFAHSVIASANAFLGLTVIRGTFFSDSDIFCMAFMLKSTFSLIIFVLLLKKKRDVSSHLSMLGEHLFFSRYFLPFHESHFFLFQYFAQFSMQ